ncbi:MAG TPA: sugar phosphate isomerase/epimerase [Planctomycetota bacterium]|nr:sugar phosphate isomerase/epimerase [Planctomycetota bacterium]
MPYRISAFADEISTDIQVQMDHLLENGVTWCAMRGCNGKNVMDLEDFQVKLTKTQFHNRGIKFSCIGSPVGKIKITDPFEPELARLKKAAALAKAFETKVIRVFSFYVPSQAEAPTNKTEVLKRMKELADLAKAEGVNLELENEVGLYGDTSDRHLEILEHINSGHVRAAFDFANYVNSGDDPLKAWPKMKKWVVDFHIKDGKKGQEVAVPIGQGDGKAKEILQDAFSGGWGGYLTLEPHLSEAGQFKGFTGGKLFKVAAEALKGLLTEVGAK